VFGFLGPNGAGKSDDDPVVLGVLQPSGGQATVLGLHVVRDSVEIRRSVGSCPGGISFYDSLTGEEVLDYLSDSRAGQRPVARFAVRAARLPASVLRRKVRD